MPFLSRDSLSTVANCPTLERLINEAERAGYLLALPGLAQSWQLGRPICQRSGRNLWHSVLIEAQYCLVLVQNIEQSA